METSARNALIGFLALALFGALMFWLASRVSNRSMLSTPEEESEQPPTEVASLAPAIMDAPDGGAGDVDRSQPGE